VHFVGQGGWSDAAVLGKVREMVLPQIERHGRIESMIIDDTSFPKKGEHSVGVGTNIADSLASRRIARWRCRCRLPTTRRACRWLIDFNLPKDWAEDKIRRHKTGVPEEIGFKTSRRSLSSTPRG
jgi:SRSO17 transposase